MASNTFAIPGLAIFGAGVDGTLIQTANNQSITLSKDTFYKSVVIKKSGSKTWTMNTNGYRLFVMEQLLLDDGCTIQNNGSDADGGAGNTLGAGQNGGAIGATPGANTDGIGGNGGSGTAAGGISSLAANKGTPYDTFFWTSGGYVSGNGAITGVKGGGGGGGGLATPGGGGGGIVWIAAKEIVLKGTAKVKANGASGIASGGGGGGAVVIRAISLAANIAQKSFSGQPLFNSSSPLQALGASPGGTGGKVIVFSEGGTYVLRQQ